MRPVSLILIRRKRGVRETAEIAAVSRVHRRAALTCYLLFHSWNWGRAKSKRSPPMKIVTYNVNGLRQRVSQHGSLLRLLTSLDADIICFQALILPDALLAFSLLISSFCITIL
ncbi:hypothetical protein BHE74_00015811 [Ensete ventricosum]|nr:hypothetical protein GW17_00004795 [Ensete ventricosum]RWW76122.1 hypothetical protein BHE74_00015811 [Ensete ventricosum]RZR98848.1 hypothetical protein BHM03_00028293 [Ensete ventricosum]